MTTLLAAAPVVGGCDAVCPDNRPSCDQRYPAARLAVHEGGRWAGTRDVWGDAIGQLRGDIDDGTSWSVTTLDGSIVVGQPDAGRVSIVTPPTGIQTLDAARALSLDDPAPGFGSLVVTSPDPSQTALWVTAPASETFRGEVLHYDDPLGAPTAGPDVRVRGTTPGDRLGEALVGCPDLTGDGQPDWLVGLPGFSGLPGDESPDAADLAGAVALIDAAKVSGASGEVGIREVSTLWWGTERGAGVGTTLACGADLTGDGVPELVIGVPWGDDRSGRVLILSGGALPASGALDGAAWRTLLSPEPGAWFGAALALGDFNGDGVTDLAVGGPGAENGRGTVWIFDGRDLAGAEATVDPVSTIRLGPDSRYHLGKVLASGRVGPDTLDDLVIGVHDWSTPSQFDQGRALIFDGTPSFRPALTAGEDENRVIRGSQAFQRVGRGLHLADLTGDGSVEVLLPTRDRAP